MRPSDLIMKKRNGGKLTEEEISFFVKGVTNETIPDYQISAFLMAVYFKGMDDEETMLLTREMMNSGKVMQYNEVDEYIVDKHSTGGVGDKTTIILAPMVVAGGGRIASIAGRGLGHTGGTIDKLESIKGFTVDISVDDFYKAVKNVGCGLIGQTRDIAPADKRLYAIRDVTATVESIPLITGSIMSKKLAEGVDGLVLDVKTGSGAFMKTYDMAETLANSLVAVGKRMGRDVVALVTDMNQPLGHYVGNSLEIMECIETMKGNGPEDLTGLCIELASHMIYISGKADNIEHAREITSRTLEDGSALEKFKDIILSQGGITEVCDDYSLLPQAKYQLDVKAEQDGYINEIDTEKIGLASAFLGGGRTKMGDELDYGVGLKINKKLGCNVRKGDSLVTVYYNPSSNKEEAIKLIEEAYSINKEKKENHKLIYNIIK
jgi:pyrimidine-nucleoside phosphorylase